MDEMSADEARRNWRELLERAHFRGEPIGITRNGKPWAVLVSREWYEQAQQGAAATSGDPTLTPAEVTWALMRYYAELGHGALMPTATDLFRLARKPLFAEPSEKQQQ